MDAQNTSAAPQPTAAAQPPLVLQPPEVVKPVDAASARDLVPLPTDMQQKIEQQVSAVVSGLLSQDMQSPDFKSKIDALFRLGRQEISNASALMTGRFMERNFVGVEDSAAFKSILSMRHALDDLNPGKQGDLLEPKKFLGLIPFGNRLQDYFRKFQSASTQLQTVMGQLSAARDDMQRDAAEIELTRGKLWDAMQKLKGAIQFAQSLDSAIAGRVEELKVSDPPRAKTLEQEVLFYARQNLQDMQTQMAVNINGYLSLEVLKKTAREMINGCDRVATTGMSALATAQTVARATGNQIEVMNMLSGVNDTIGDLVTQTSRQLGEHVQKTGEFAANPLIGVQRIQEMMDNTFKAMDAMDTFRSQAIDAMGKNNQMIKEQIARSEQYIERSRAAPSSGSSLPDGPVKL